MDLATKRLCLFCKKLEPKDQPCPWLQSQPKTAVKSTTNGNQQQLSEAWTAQDENLLRWLRQHPSALCRRCSDFDILQHFKHANPLDHEQRRPFSRSENVKFYESRLTIQMPLGLISTFVLTPSCQLCRLIYRILSRPRPDHDNNVLALDPYRWYLRHDGWEAIPASARESYAIFFGVSSPDATVSTLRSYYTDGKHRNAERPGEAIALLSSPGSVKTGFEARSTGELIDFSRIRDALDSCETSHWPACQRPFDKGLLKTMMVDVTRRKVVPCPDQCDYIALSYVWGGVHPVADALQTGKLPQTIEDALAVAKKLGRRYAWIDALCIDQTLNPTPQQAAAKQEQLGLMHLIYSGASVTLCAVSGKDSNAGIPGVSRKRIPATQEVIDGATLCTVPAEILKEVDASIWNARAWTFQEGILNSRRLLISETQYKLSCQTIGPGQLSEACDQVLDLKLSTLRHLADHAAQSKYASKRADEVYGALTSVYTARKMTNEVDSINAYQGILNALLEQGVFRHPPLFGLPLKDMPESIGWVHDKCVNPKRRLNFPSWSWAGWEGKVTYIPPLLDGSNAKMDLQPQVHDIKGKELTLQGWIVTLDIRTDPFSEVVIPGTDTSIGCVRERDFLHNNTLPSGRYRCLVAARVKEEVLGNGLDNQCVFLVVLKGTASNHAERQTGINIRRLAQEGKDFMEFGPRWEKITLV